MPLTNAAGVPNSGLVVGGVIGIVDDLEDPTKAGRVRVKFPHLQTELKSWWLRVATPHGGKEQGIWSIPDKGDEVLVMFTGANQDEGIVIATLYNGKDMPPKEAYDKLPKDPGGPTAWAGGWPAAGESKHHADGKLNRFLWRSREGHLFMMDDSKGKESMVLFDKGRKLAMAFDTVKGKIYIASGDTDVVIRAAKNILIEATENIKMKAGKSIEIESGQDSKWKTGTDWKVDAGTNIDMKAATNVKQKAGANFDGEAGANLKLKAGAVFAADGGATAKLNSSGPTIVKGATVMIN